MRPTRALVALLVVWGLAGIAASAWAPALPPWNLLGAALILASVLDLAALLRAPVASVRVSWLICQARFSQHYT